MLKTVELLSRQIQGCTDASQVREIHARVIDQGLGKNLFLGNHLVDIYAKCGCLADAELVFQALPRKNVFSWTVMIDSYAEKGRVEKVLLLLGQMQLHGVFPNEVTLASVFKACPSLEAGRRIHSTICEVGLTQDLVLGTSLVSFYGRCGTLPEAVKAFDAILEKNVVARTAMISAYIDHGQPDTALMIFREMDLEGHPRNAVTFATILQACGELENLQQDAAR